MEAKMEMKMEVKTEVKMEAKLNVEIKMKGKRKKEVIKIKWSRMMKKRKMKKEKSSKGIFKVKLKLSCMVLQDIKRVPCKKKVMID